MCPIDTKECYNHFWRINDPGDDFVSANPDITERIENIMIDDISIVFDEVSVPISLNEVSESTKQLKNGKVCAEDPLVNESFKHGSDLLAPHLASILTSTREFFPEDWCERLVIPLLKRTRNTLPEITEASLFSVYRGTINSRCPWKNIWHHPFYVQPSTDKGV